MQAHLPRQLRIGHHGFEKLHFVRNVGVFLLRRITPRLVKIPKTPLCTPHRRRLAKIPTPSAATPPPPVWSADPSKCISSSTTLALAGVALGVGSYWHLVVSQVPESDILIRSPGWELLWDLQSLLRAFFGMIGTYLPQKCVDKMAAQMTRDLAAIEAVTCRSTGNCRRNSCEI